MYIASGFWSLNRYKSRLTSTPLPPRFTMSPLMTQGLLQINPILFKYKQWITKLTVHWTKRVINDSLMLHIETAGVAESTNVSFFTYSTTDSDYNQSVYFLSASLDHILSLSEGQHFVQTRGRHANVQNIHPRNMVFGFSFIPTQTRLCLFLLIFVADSIYQARWGNATIAAASTLQNASQGDKYIQHIPLSSLDVSPKKIASNQSCSYR